MATGVSSSSATAALTCWQRWVYAHHPDYNIVPKTLGPALTRGISGHSVLEAFYAAIYDGATIKSARKDAKEELLDLALTAGEEGDPIKAQVLSELSDTLEYYFDYYSDDIETWDILSVELRQDMPLLDDSVYLPSRLDLVAKARKGKYKGEVHPVDHKFVYDFWPEDLLTLNTQMPLYIATTRHQFPNEIVKRAVVNQIRYRFKDSDKVPLRERPESDVFRRDVITPTANEILVTLEDHTLVAKNIARYMQIPAKDLKLPRAITKPNCEYCHYTTLCMVERRGDDPKHLIQAQFKKNDYGYDERTD